MNHQRPGPAVAILYFACSVFAAGELASWIATANVRAQRVSHFEGAAGYAFVLQLPVWYVLVLLLLCLAYLPLRRRPSAIVPATIVLAALAIPTLKLVVQLVW